MVIVQVTVETSTDAEAAAFIDGIREGCATAGWHFVDGQRLSQPDHPCPECGAPMAFDPTFQGFVCHHPEE